MANNMWARLDNGQLRHHRINGHRYITHRNIEESPVVLHFNSEGHTLADMTVVVIHNSCLCKTQESRWISTLGTSYPSGTNLWVDSL